MATPLIPWEPCNIPEELQGELNRRKVNRSFKYVNGAKGGWDSNDGDWTKYRGPTTPWVRFCSNGYGREFLNDGKTPNPNPKPGFVFFGGKNFYNGYGFEKNSNGVSQGIIGYVPNEQGTPHFIDNDLKTSDYPIHVPAPEIEKITVTIQKELFRRATVEWVCFSKKQLEYMTPYFLVPGITCVLEWGWNNFNPSSLIRLDKEDELKRLNDNPYPLYTKNILQSKGNYDVLFGKITQFSWRADGNKFHCKTEITSQDRIYAGLVLDSNAVDQVKKDTQDDEDLKPLNTLSQFISKNLSQFKSVFTTKNPESIPDLSLFIQYLQKQHPTTWQEYVYGVFYGRDLEQRSDNIVYDNKKEDFDRKASGDDLWLSLGLIMEVINFHAAALTSFNSNEMFRIDIEDCVIGGHPNLMSTNGEILLIPNAAAPKYFSGAFGRNLLEFGSEDENDYDFILDRSTNPSIGFMTREEAKKYKKLPDYRIQKICLPINKRIKRDNLDDLINYIRYAKVGKGTSFEFPFLNDKPLVKNSTPYPAKYSGLLKNLYFNVKCLQTLTANTSEIKTYPKLIEKMLEKINEAAGNFWDFRIVSGTGKDGQAVNAPATMKIVDYRFMSTANRGTVYTFNSFDSDSILLGMEFTPTLSDAQAIRTIYAQTNNPDKKTVLTNGENELLDYKFRDRLFKGEEKKFTKPTKAVVDRFDEVMRDMQQITPPPGAYQMTVKTPSNGIIVRRLVLPATEVLKLLLDDGDEEHNPKYTGIMPGIQASFTIQGIGGLRTFMMFLVRNLPEPYSHKNIVFRIIDVQESIDMGKWTTVITAGIIPLREHIKTRLRITS